MSDGQHKRRNIHFDFQPYDPGLLARVEAIAQGRHLSADHKALASDMRALALFTLEVVGDVEQLIDVIAKIGKAGVLQATTRKRRK